MRSGKPHKDIGSSPPCHLAGPPTLQTNTNTAQKIPTGFSRQSQDTYVLKQECSHRTSAVAPEHSNRKRQYHQSSCPQAVHNLRRLQSGLKWEIHESNSSNLVSALLTQCQKDAENHGTMCFYRSTMGLRHSFTCPYQGQAFFCVKKWFEAQMSRSVPDAFSYISHFVCLCNFDYTDRPLCGLGITGIICRLMPPYF